MTKVGDGIEPLNLRFFTGEAGRTVVPSESPDSEHTRQTLPLSCMFLQTWTSLILYFLFIFDITIYHFSFFFSKPSFLYLLSLFQIHDLIFSLLHEHCIYICILKYNLLSMYTYMYAFRTDYLVFDNHFEDYSLGKTFFSALGIPWLPVVL